MTTPNTPANGGQILTWQERMAKHGNYVGRNEATVEQVCKEAEIADLRATLPAPASLTVDRNAVIEEVALAFDAGSMLNISEHYAQQRIRALKSAAPEVAQPAAQVAMLEGFLKSPEGKTALDSYRQRTTPATDKPAEKKPLTRCAARSDDDMCTHAECPQLRDNEPHATGRHCPLDTRLEDEQ